MLMTVMRTGVFLNLNLERIFVLDKGPKLQVSDTYLLDI